MVADAIAEAPPPAAPAPLQSVTADFARNATLTAQNLPADYAKVARSFQQHPDERVTEIIEGIEKVQRASEGIENFPAPFVCIFDSSGTGKTQLAATTALLRNDSRVVYLYVGESTSETAQTFYLAHIPLWTRLKPLLIDFCLSHSNGANTELPGAGAMLDNANSHVLVTSVCQILFPQVDANSINTTNELAKMVRKVQKTKAPFFVFLDEIPPSKNNQNFAALALRNFLRAIGIAPILMSTHSGSHNALPVGADSRGRAVGYEVPPLWCHVMTKLPRQCREVDYKYKTNDERPLIAQILSTLPASDKANLQTSVNCVRNFLLGSKPNAWRRTPIFQLCLLFRSTRHEQDRDLCSHRLVGEHFGHFEMENGTSEILRQNPHLRGKVRMPEAEREPLLFLALASWKADDMTAGRFPLQNEEGEALTVRKAFEECKNEFVTNAVFANPDELKNDGSSMEALSLASMTLASLCSDEGLLSGVPFVKYVAMVFAFMLNASGEALKARVETWPEALDQFLSTQSHGHCRTFLEQKVPAVPSAASEFQDLLFIDGNSALRGTLKRPKDLEQRDGALDWVASSGSGTLIHVECKNYSNGLDMDTLEAVISRMRHKSKVSFLFTSKLNGVWKSDEMHDDFWKRMGLEEGELCILHLVEHKGCLRASWLSAFQGRVLEPRSNCKYLFVVFCVDAVKPS